MTPRGERRGATACSLRDPFTHSTKGASMTRTRSITFLASATVPVLAALAVAACGSSGGSNASGPRPRRGPRTDSRPRSASRTRTSARSSSTRRAARSTCSEGTLARTARAPAPAQSSGRHYGRPASRRSAAERLLRSSRPAPARTENHRSPTTAIPLYLFSGDQKPGDTNGEGVNAFGGLWYALSSAGDQIVRSASNSGIGY